MPSIPRTLLKKKTVISYNGFLYIAWHPSEPFLLKIGHTRVKPSARNKGLHGQLLVEFEQLYVVECNDSLNAETLVHAYLDTLGTRVQPLKEMFFIDFETAVELVDKAVALAPVRKAYEVHAKVETKLTHSDKSWLALLSLPICVNKSLTTLGVAMAQSLGNAGLSRQLERKGVYCTYPHPTSPEFLVTSLDEESVHWLQCKQVSPGQLHHARTGEMQSAFSMCMA